jgi:hypothetical protein
VPLFYVTGLSGAGKSAVLAELRARGYRARGVDEDGYADWISKETRAVDRFPHGDLGLDMHAWIHTHDWVLSVPRITRLRRAVARLGEPVFLCGVASGDDAVWHLFDRVLALVADLPELHRRIAARSGNVFGQDAAELEIIAGWHRDFESSYRRFGALIIDAGRPLPEVVTDILAETVGSRPGDP